MTGGQPASGTVLLTGHWDHLGLCRPVGAPDRICNGAVDNASGIAVLLATGRALGAGARPDRNIEIVATTAEEDGLLGASYFTAHPPLPLNSIIAAFNVDTVAIAPRGASVAIVGRGTTPALDAVVDATAVALGRQVDSSTAANAFIRRQDGWALVQAGVPAVMAGGSFADEALLDHFMEGAYHGPDDEMNPSLNLGGAADDADLHIALARRLGSVRGFAGLAPH